MGILVTLLKTPSELLEAEKLSGPFRASVFPIEKDPQDKDWETFFLYAEGLNYFSKNNYKKAAKAFEAAFAVMPDCPVEQRTLGQCYEQLGRPEDAIKAYERVIYYNSQYKTPYQNLIALYKKRGQTRKEVAVWEELLKNNPDDAVIKRRFRRRWETLSRRAFSKRARVVTPDPEKPGSLVEISEARERFQKKGALGQGFNSKAEIESDHLFEEALKLEASGDLKKATELYERSMAFNSGSALNRGILYVEENKLNEAKQAFLAALRIQPEYPLAWFDLAYCCDDLGQREEAIRYYREALNSSTPYMDAHYNLALLLQKDPVTKMEAMAHWRAYIRHDASPSWQKIARNELNKLIKGVMAFKKNPVAETPAAAEQPATPAA